MELDLRPVGDIVPIHDRRHVAKYVLTTVERLNKAETAILPPTTCPLLATAARAWVAPAASPGAAATPGVVVPSSRPTPRPAPPTRATAAPAWTPAFAAVSAGTAAAGSAAAAAPAAVPASAAAVPVLVPVHRRVAPIAGPLITVPHVLLRVLVFVPVFGVHFTAVLASVHL